jgi:hypothetical protein
VKDIANRWVKDPQKGKGEIMKKVLMVIFVLSLLGLLAAPVLATVLAETGPYNEVAPRLPGTTRRAGLESMLAEGLIDIGIPFYKIAPPPGTIRLNGVEDQMLAEGLIKEGPPSNELTPPPGTLRPMGGENPVQVAKNGCWLPVEPPTYAPRGTAWSG